MRKIKKSTIVCCRLHCKLLAVQISKAVNNRIWKKTEQRFHGVQRPPVPRAATVADCLAASEHSGLYRVIAVYNRGSALAEESARRVLPVKLVLHAAQL